MSEISKNIAKRRTFAIISHPDAGKTTLTEKLLLFGGAIQMAGAVKARGEQRRAHSDWMKVERERGISVTSSVMTFHYKDTVFNLLDTPGHQDFSEDTYRTLTAVDSAIMVLDAAKGIEAQTRKLFEVCRLRDIPIITFINKLDRESQDPFALLDEIENTLALDLAPMTWPIGMGQHFKGCYDLEKDHLILMERSRSEKPVVREVCQGIGDTKIDSLIASDQAEKLREDVSMIRELCPQFSQTAFLEGHMTPVYFGSAVNAFGVQELIEGLATHAPAPRAQKAQSRTIQPEENKLTGFVFKIQANMDPKHRDRMAFMRIASGRFGKNMKIKHVRSGKTITLNNPVLFLARDKEVVEEAYAGDIIGIPNHGLFHLGDSISEGESVKFTDIPAFAPELLQRIRPKDPMKAKHLSRALEQLAQEGVTRVFKPQTHPDWILGVVGTLQFDIVADRIRTEYDIAATIEPCGFITARWLKSDGAAKLKSFLEKNASSIGEDHEGQFVFLARNAWHLDDAIANNPDITFQKIRENLA